MRFTIAVLLSALAWPAVGANPPARPPKLKAAGATCTTSAECDSGLCAGLGCGPRQGLCAARLPKCTADLQTFCDCAGDTFRASSTCPGRRYAHRGACTDADLAASTTACAADADCTVYFRPVPCREPSPEPLNRTSLPLAPQLFPPSTEPVACAPPRNSPRAVPPPRVTCQAGQCQLVEIRSLGTPRPAVRPRGGGSRKDF